MDFLKFKHVEGDNSLSVKTVSPSPDWVELAEWIQNVSIHSQCVFEDGAPALQVHGETGPDASLVGNLSKILISIR